MPKNGFTLVELLAVIVILVIFVSIATFGVINVMNKGKSDVGEFTKQQMQEAATAYALDHDYCENPCFLRGKTEIMNNLKSYFPEIEDKCQFASNAKLTISWGKGIKGNLTTLNEGVVNVVIENIECRK